MSTVSDASPLERPSPRIRPLVDSLYATLSMHPRSETLRKPVPIRNISFQSYTLRCTTVLKQPSISVLSVVDPKKVVEFELLLPDLEEVRNKLLFLRITKWAPTQTSTGFFNHT